MASEATPESFVETHVDFVIGQLASSGVTRVDLTGGEPLYSPHFIKVLRCAAKYGMSVGVIATAGDLITDKIASAVSSVLGKLPVFAISLDSVSEHGRAGLHDGTVNRRTLAGIDLLGQLGGEVWLLTVVNEASSATLLEIRRWADERPWVTKWRISPVRPSGGAAHGSPLCSPESFDTAIAPLLSLDGSSRQRLKINDSPKYNWLYEHPKFDAMSHPCAYLDGVITIGANGDVVSCPPGMETGCDLFVHGSLAHSALNKILTGANYRRFWDLEARDLRDCALCALLPNCGGGCRALAALWADDLFGCDVWARWRMTSLAGATTQGDGDQCTFGHPDRR